MNLTTLIVVTVLVTVGGAEAKRVTNQQPVTMSPAVAGFLLGMILFIVGLFSDEITEDFCYLIIVSSLIVNGTSIATALTAHTGPTVKPVAPTLNPSAGHLGLKG